MPELILTTLALALGTLIVGILLGPIPTSTDPIRPRPEPAPRPTPSTGGHEMPHSAEWACYMSLYLSASGIARGTEGGSGRASLGMSHPHSLVEAAEPATPSSTSCF